MQNMKISVLMSVYSEPNEWIQLAIDSILNQTHSDIEFVIVNDNPDCERVCTLLQEYAKKDSRIVLVTNKHNMGLVKSLNNGLNYATGEYIARMDADDISYLNRLERELEYLIQNGYDFISACCNKIDANGNLLLKCDALSYDKKATKMLLRWTNPVAHTIWFAKREVFVRLNGYRGVDCAEDYDFLLRALKAGYAISVCGEVLLDCRINSVGISRQNLLRQFLVLKYLAKNMETIESFDAEAINRHISRKVNEKRECAYRKAKDTIAAATKASLPKMLLYVVKSMFMSRYAIPYLYYVLRVRSIRKKYGRS